MLLEKGADVNATDKEEDCDEEDESALYAAAHEGHHKIVEMLFGEWS
jgi:hypothetical protein